jgi:Fe-S-cluster containining protein
MERLLSGTSFQCLGCGVCLCSSRIQYYAPAISNHMSVKKCKECRAFKNINNEAIMNDFVIFADHQL